MSDRIAVFNEGRIEQVGPPAEVYEHPRTEFVAGFVGVSNCSTRDGRTLSVRPEKIRILDDGARPNRERTSSRGRSARSSTRDGNSLHRGAGRRRRADRRRPEPRDDLGTSTRGARQDGAAPVAAEHERRTRDTGTKETDDTKTKDDSSGLASSPSWGRSRSWARMRWRRRRGRRHDDQASGAQLKQSIGKGEGEVNLIAWAGYVEDGSTDPKVDWVTRSRRRRAARST